MPIPNTVPVTADLRFQDSFTGPATQALEQFRATAESNSQAVANAEAATFTQMKAVEQTYKSFHAVASSNTLVFKQFGYAISASFEDAIIHGEKFGNVMQKLGYDVEKIILRLTVTRALESALGGFLGGLDLPIPGFANGGSVFPDKTILVGENGPELFRPSTSGDIIPNDQIGGGNNVTVHMNISTPDVNGFVQNRGAILAQMNQAIQRGARNS